MRTARNSTRRGTVIPILGVCLIALFTFVALAVDLGVVAVARTDAQNAADIAALAGTRQLNNKPGVTDSNRTNAIATAKAAIKLNNDVNAVYQDSEITSVIAGQYNYDTTSQTFSVSYPSSISTGQSWTAMEVKIAVDQPTFFMKVWGVTSLPTSARAVAVHRPRDIALVIDMTGSMGYGSVPRLADVITAGSGLNDPSTMWPQFAHYQRYTGYSTNNITGSETGTLASRPNPFQQMGSKTSAPYIYSPANLTIETPNGKAIVRDFLYDPANLTTQSTAVTSVTVANLRKAMHQWSPPESNADPTNLVGPTYDTTGYNAFDTTGTTGAMPAPDNFKTQSDSPNTYVGDKYPRKSGAPGTTAGDSWDPTTTNGAATHLAEYLGWTTKYSSGSTLPTAFNPASGGPTWSAGVGRSWANFRDATWERYGYDLDVADYVSNRTATWDPRFDWDKTLNGGTGGWAHAKGSTEAWPSNTYRPRVTAGKFKGYSMGPGYFGKSFMIWPPDPRTPVGNPGDANYQAGDWRTRYFNTTGGSDLTSQGANAAILTNGAGSTLKAASGKYAVDYAAVLKWIKSGPMTLTPNLRSGHVLYYSSIPDTVAANGGDSAAVAADKVFWKAYIDYVLHDGGLAGTEVKGWPEGVTPSISATANSAYSYTWTPAPVSIAPTAMNGAKKLNASTAVINTTAAHGLSTGDSVVIAGVGVSGYNGTYTVTVTSPTQFTYAKATSLANSGGGTATKQPETISDPVPDMTYTDNPSRPRLHGWFGPLTMMMFLNEYNYWSGTTHQAQSWQLKAGVNSALDDIRANHPNDYCGMAFFTTSSYTDIMVAPGQDYTSLKNSLFFPKSKLAAILTDNTTELRPYTSSGLTNQSGDIPNAQNSTDPVSGMAYAFNILSPAPGLNTDANRRGRRGAAKVVIFETDGIPNATQSITLNKNGYNSYYTYSGSFTTGLSASSASSPAITVVQQIVKQTATNSTSGVDSGYSLPNSPARVYAIGFGDIFSTTSGQTAKDFLLSIQQNGNTSAATDTSIPSYQIITGAYQDRIDNLRTALERILQGGVQVTLVE